MPAVTSFHIKVDSNGHRWLMSDQDQPVCAFTSETTEAQIDYIVAALRARRFTELWPRLTEEADAE